MKKTKTNAKSQKLTVPVPYMVMMPNGNFTLGVNYPENWDYLKNKKLTDGAMDALKATAKFILEELRPKMRAHP